MDPKQGGQKPLDPNLQAAYDRVMGVSLTGEPTAPQSAEPTTGPALIQSSEPTAPSVPAATPAEPVTPPMSEPTIPTTPTTPPPTNPVPDLPTISIPGETTPVSPVSDLPTAPPTEPASPVLPVMPSVPPTAPSDTADIPVPTPSSSMESLSATVAMPQVIPHDTETVKIGMGGSPAGSTSKAKSKGVSPVILIVGAFAFLVIYAIFWVRFFNYSLPFLPK